MTDVVREERDGLVILSLDRPEALNALRPSLFVELRDHFDDIAASTERLGFVILRGNGPSFSAGNDLKAIARGERAPDPFFQAETIDRIESLPQPVLASVRGYCLTGALELVLGCDLLVVGDTAKIGDTHGRWGMSPTWGMTQRLPRRVGPLVASELMFTGRQVSGAEAVTIGLANRCVPDAQLDDVAVEIARQCLENSWHSLRSQKHLVRTGLELPLTGGLAYERTTSRPAPDMEERLRGFGAKR